MSEIPKNTGVVTLSYISENAVLLEWPEKICSIQHQHIIYCQQQASDFLQENLIDSVASCASLIIYYQFENINHNALNVFLLELTQKLFDIKQNSHLSENSIVEIPVYYGQEAGWDIHNVAQQTKLSIDDVIKLHSQKTYRAYALGFTPGFCYLGKVSAQLQLPRRSSPRLSVPSGAIAIAEQQTAVYPTSSPGGWHILGQTPLQMYSEGISSSTTKHKSLCPHTSEFKSTISVGQSVKFRPISLEEFLSLSGKLTKEIK